VFSTTPRRLRDGSQEEDRRGFGTNPFRACGGRRTDRAARAKVERNPSDDSVQTPGIDPELSSDNQHSSYKQSSEEFPPDQGNQMEEVPGKP
jgi:hypothetical protein